MKTVTVSVTCNIRGEPVFEHYHHVGCRESWIDQLRNFMQAKLSRMDRMDLETVCTMQLRCAEPRRAYDLVLPIVSPLLPDVRIEYATYLAGNPAMVLSSDGLDAVHALWWSIVVYRYFISVNPNDLSFIEGLQKFGAPVGALANSQDATITAEAYGFLLSNSVRLDAEQWLLDAESSRFVFDYLVPDWTDGYYEEDYDYEE